VPQDLNTLARGRKKRMCQPIVLLDIRTGSGIYPLEWAKKEEKGRNHDSASFLVGSQSPGGFADDLDRRGKGKKNAAA